MLEVDDLKVCFRDWDGGVSEAVKGVSFSVEKGETLAVVGESGSGKSVTALALARLLPEPPAEISSGTIRVGGKDVLGMSEGELRALRGAEIGYVFQEPGTALNPVFSIRSQMAEVIRLHRPEVVGVDAEIVRWLDRVGIVDAEKRLRAYPHELSGGMQQRVMIAMALAGRPGLLVADEPTTALDVTVQKKIMALLRELQGEFGMGILLITHNFGIIGDVADRVAVMYQGEIVETGGAREVVESPQHPYTKALIGCIPRTGQNRRRLVTAEDFLNPGGGSGADI